MSKKPKKTKQPVQVEINDCTFTGSDSAGVLALAKALEANARAIEALCQSVKAGSGPLLSVDGNLLRE